MTRLIPLFVVFLATACGGKDGPSDTDSDAGPPPPPLAAGAPVAGAAEGVLELPIGTPLAGFTSRCSCLGSTSKQDDRDSAYTDRFIESTGVHIRPTIKVVWVTNGDRHLVMTKTDTIYSFDVLVDDITTRLEAQTGETLRGMVTHSANHNHSSYGTYSQHTGLFLGHDKFSRENYERMVQQIVDVAVAAYNSREPAAIGMGIAKDWDPDNQVYSDRRGINNDLVVFEDMGPEQGGKDPYLHLLRVDKAGTTDPIAVVFAWGMHPYVFGEDMPLATADATALVEAEISEHFPGRKVVSMFIQTGGGDASVRGGDEGWARMETVGARARDAILALREDTPTTSEPILLETMSQSVPMEHDKIRVTRGGQVDWVYGPLIADDADTRVDNIVYDENGDIVSPLDEWGTEYGGVFCGSGFGDLPVGKLAVNITGPYANCIRVGFMTNILKTFFKLSDDDVALPLAGMRQTYTAASKFGPIPVRRADGTTVTEPVLLGFFPGEPLHFYTEMWRRRTAAELGVADAVLFGYSMDHEGYLAIAEDWLLNEYESDITFQGPLAGEWIMENVITMGRDILGTDVGEFYDARRGVDTYDEISQAVVRPDDTPNAGTRLLSGQTPEYFWIPEGFTLDLDIPAQLPRVEGIVQLAWEGGDPAVDNPSVTLEFNQGSAEAPDWQPVQTPGGRIVNEDHHDFAIGHTPDPLFPAEAAQRHYYWGVWQAVAHLKDRAGLPLGQYRLRVDGHRYTGSATEWPWDAEPYTFSTDPFELVEAPVTVEVEGAEVRAWIQGPSEGFRLVDEAGFSRGRNPLVPPVTVTWTFDDAGSVSTESDPPLDAPTQVDNLGARDAARGGWTTVAVPSDRGTLVEVTIEDAYGNAGTWSLPR